MKEIPIVYIFNPLTFRPLPGFGQIYLYEVSGKKYIGQTINTMRQRHRAHIKPYNFQCIVDEYLSKEEYKLKILQVAPQNQLNELEVYFVENYNTMWPNGWNFTPGGRNYERSDQARLVNSYKHTGSKNGFYGKKHTEEEIQKMLKSRKETIANKTRQDWQNPKNCKKVYQYDLNMKYIREFSSLREQQDYTNIERSSIRKACNGKYKYQGNYKWSFEKV